MSLVAKLSAVVGQLPGQLGRFAPRGGSIRAAFALGGATFAAQAAGVLLSPVYSRLYSPADYGVFGAHSAVVTTALMVGSLSYETGIPVGKDLGLADMPQITATLANVLKIDLPSAKAPPLSLGDQ